MPACLGNTATPHVLLLKKCHTRWYTASRAWPGQRSEEEISLTRAEAGKTDSCTSTWTQEAKTLNCQPRSPEPPPQCNGAFSLHTQLEALRSLRASIFEILCSILFPKWKGSRLLTRRIFFPHIIPTAGSTQLQAEPWFSCCVVALPCNSDLLRHVFPPLLGSIWQVIFPWQLLHLPHYYTEHLQKHFRFQNQLFLSKTIWWFRVFCSF